MADLLKWLRPHRHHWTQGGREYRRISEVPKDSIFFRLDCECGKSIDGAKLRRMLKPDAPAWLLRNLGFEEEEHA